MSSTKYAGSAYFLVLRLRQDYAAAMYCLTVNLSSAEWVKIREAASKQWPGETLSHSEVLRRYVLIGIAKLKNIPQQDAKRLAYELQCSMTVGDTRLRD